MNDELSYRKIIAGDRHFNFVAAVSVPSCFCAFEKVCHCTQYSYASALALGSVV
jgi:hypothetical protein